MRMAEEVIPTPTPTPTPTKKAKTMSYQRNNASFDSFGKSKNVKRRAALEARGDVSVKAGPNGGGPCPAVCLATLTGWHYQRAAKFLKARTGFSGRGDVWERYIPAIATALGQTPEYVAPVGTVATTVHRVFAGRSGAIRCRGHVMPVLNGRLLNASPRDESARCEGAVIFDIGE